MLPASDFSPGHPILQGSSQNPENHKALKSLNLIFGWALINGLKREQLIASNSMILHELFFDSLGQQSEPDAPLTAALARDFGSVDRWRSEFMAMGKAQGGGSGWVLLTYSPRFGRLVNQWAMDHTTVLAAAQPILALDMYEHSYHMDYGAKAATYVETFMAAINWVNVRRAYDDLRMV